MEDTPKVRFKGFTGAWEQRKLGTIISEKLSNGVINKSGTQCSNVKHINVINMYTPDKIHTDDLTPSSHDENTIYKCNVEVGDIFMTRSSLKPEGIAEANVLLDSGRYVFDDHLIRMKVDKSKYDPIFVKINLGNKMIKTQFVMRSKTTAFTTIGQEDILECDGMFPLFDEQTKIGEYFQKLEDIITFLQHKCDETIELKKYMLQKMFPQNGQKIPEIRFAGFTDEWEQRKLMNLVDVIDGDRGKNYPMEIDFSENGHTLFLNASNVTVNGFSFDTNQYISELKSNSMGSGRLQEDDIIITSRGSLGHIAWYNTDISIKMPYVRINSGMLILRRREKIVTSYLYQYMKSEKGKGQISFMSFGSAQPQLTKKGVENLKVIFPKNEEEQKQIGDYFCHLDHLITLHQHKCDELKQVKKFMLQNMFPQKG